MKSFLFSCGFLASTFFSFGQFVVQTQTAQAAITKIQSQNWAQAMQSPDANLYDVQEKFYAYWAGKDITEKGKGYKAFKRWESFTAPRVYPSGQVGLLNQNAKNYNDFLISTYGAQAPQNGGGKAGGGNLIASTTWTPMGPFGPLTGSAGGQLNKNGRMCFITIDPTNTLNLWVGAPAGGLWKTINGGTTWTTNTDNLGVIGCSDLAIDPITPSNMYLATGDGDAGDTKSIGVLKSTDGGTTWNATGLVFPVGNGILIRRLIINPTNPLILMAATNAGIYRTTNGGTSWAVVQAANCYDLEFQPTNSLVVYAGGATFRRSTDGGATWTQIGGVMPTSGVTRMAIAVTTADINRVYVLAGNNTNSGMLGIYQSTDAGLTFSNISPGGGINVLGWNTNGLDLGGQDWYDLAIASSPLNPDEVVTGGVNIWRRTAAGNTWTLYGHWTGGGAPFIHADHHDLEYDPAGNLYGTNDGTVYKRTGATWTEISGNSFNISQIYKIGTSAITANKWITGHQDNGTNIWTGATYTCSIGGDGMDCYIDRTNDANMFGETYNGSFRRSTNGGATWSGYTSGMSGTAPWVSIWKQDPQTANTIYGAYTNLFKSILSTGTWTQLAALPSTNQINEFAVAPSNSLIIYVLKNAGIYKTINGGASWTTITGAVPVGSGAPTFITISPTDPLKAWVTLSGYSAGNKVFRTIDGGTTWTNFTANLPNLPANCSVYQPTSADRIYVGMDIGVYYRDNVAANWTLYNTGLPNTPLSDMEISPADPTKLIAATYGRGVWKVDLIANLAPVSSFSFSGNACTGSALVFTDLSANGPTSWSWSVTPAAGVVINTPASQNPTITFANAGNYTVSLIASNIVGPGPVTSQTLAITATPTVAVTSSVQTICAGATTIITASGAGSYTWTGGPLTNTISVTPTATTIYTVIGASGVCLSAPKTATVNTNPSPTVSVNSPSICSGSSTVLTASGAASYSWSTGPVTNTISVSPTLTTVYTVTGTTAGCTNVRTATVTVNTTPTVAVTSSVQTICAGTTTIITASGAGSYTWTAGPLTNTISVTPLSTTVYTVTGANGNCTNIKTATVNVNASPTINVNSPTICAGSNTILTASGAASYTWSTGPLTNTISVSPTLTTVYTVTGTAAGCSNVQTTTVNVNTVNVTVTNSVQSICAGTPTVITANGAASYSWSNGPVTNTISVSPTLTTVYTVTGTTAGCTSVRSATVNISASPTVVISNSVQTACAGSSVTINSSGATTYSWSNAATSSVIIVSPLVTTIYTLVGSNGGCSAQKTATVNINPLPVINASANTTLLCNGDVVTLNSSGASSYTWQPGNLNGPFITDNPGSTTVYTCSGTDVNGCVGTTTILITVSSCNGILQNGAEAVVFNVFPNPASENITISYPSKNSAEINIEVMDAAGKLVIKKSQVFNKNNPTLNINISNVAKGIYFLKLIPKEGNAKTVKLVKE